MLKLINFTKIYSNGKIGAKDITLTVSPGDIFAFIGHNGAGKTTTIKSIVGINDFNSGDIQINGLSMKENPIECKKLIAYVPDNPDIYNALTGIQYINLIADIFNVDKNTRTDLTNKYAKMLELDKNLNDPISTYSHGMRQKLVLISAFVHSPKLLVLDEPFVGLDPKASFTVKEIFKEFTNNGGAIFFSTHVLEVAEKICNKVAIIKDGSLIANGTMKEIKQDQTLEEVFLRGDNNAWTWNSDKKWI